MPVSFTCRLAAASTTLERVQLTPGRAGLLVFTIAIAIFANASLSGWVTLDDPLYVLNNRRILDSEFAALLRLWSFEDAHMGAFIEYFPLRDSVYWTIHRIFGVQPLPYHIVNILLHGLCSVLVVAIGRRLGFSLPIACVAAIIFAVHPVHCESVVWISGLKDPMFTALLLASVLAYEPDSSGKRSYVLSFVLLVLSLLCKSIGVMLPALLLALEWRRNALTWASLRAVAPFGVIALLFLLNFVAIGNQNNVIVSHKGLTISADIMTSLWCFVTYVSLQVFPINLNLLNLTYSIRDTGDLRGAAAVITCFSMAIGVMVLLLKHRQLAVLAIWFVLFLLPVMKIVPIPVLVAERYLYLPSVAFSLAAAAALAQLVTRYRAVGKIAALLVIFGLAARTVQRNEDWRGGDVALWQGVVSQPAAAMFDVPWVALGNALLVKQRFPEAEQALLRAIAIQGDLGASQGPVASRRAEVHYDLGRLYLASGRVDLALHHLKLVVSFRPSFAQAWNLLSSLEAESGHAARAEQAANMALTLDASLAGARITRGLVRLELGRVDEGVADLVRVVGDNPAMCQTLSQWQADVGEIPVAARVRTELAPHCP